MNYELTGVLYEKFDVMQRTATFKVREFVVEQVREASGKTFVNYIKFQSTQDKTDVIDRFNTGDKVKVYFSIRGSKWERNGQISYFNNLEAWKVEPAESGHQSASETTGSDLPQTDPSTSDDMLPF